jgi:hypothetical protein
MTVMDVTQAHMFAADLATAGVRAGIAAVGVVERGALNVKTTARGLAPSGPHTPAYASSITYTMKISGSQVAAEIGPEPRGQGNLGNIFEYGTSTQGPQSHLAPALEQEAPRFERFMAQLADGAL